MTDLSLLQDFLAETSEHLEEMERLLLLLEDDAQNKELLDDIFRSIHTIKGSSDYLGMGRIAELSHRLENLLDLMRQEKRVADQDTVDLLIDGRDRIASLVADLGETQAESTEIDDLLARLDAAVSQEPANTTTPTPDAGDAVGAETEVSEDQRALQVELSAIENESDAELLAIFLDQFEAGVEGLRKGLCDHKTLSPELIDTALGHMTSLQSSANYMGYASLCRLYEPWEQELRDLKAEISQGETEAISVQTYWQDNLKPHLVTLLNLIPAQERDFSQYLEAPDFQTTPEEAAVTDDGDTDGNSADDTTAQLFSDVCLDGLLDESSDLCESEVPTAAGSGDEPELSLDLEPDLLVDEAAEPGTGKDDVDEALLADFLEEAHEHLEEMESCILALAQSDDHSDLLNDIFRCVHTIKGSADYLGLTGITELSHQFECYLDHLRQGQAQVDNEVNDVLMAAEDQIRSMIADLAEGGSGTEPSEDLLMRLAVGQGTMETAENQTEADQSAPFTSDTGIDGAADLPLATVNYVDENDKELLDIFLQQLQEGLKTLIRLSNETESLDHGVLKQCRVQLEGLNSSANYMGYNELQQVYTDWEIHLDTQVSAIKNSADLKGRTWLVESVVPFVKSVAAFFPQVPELSGLWENLDLPEEAVSEDLQTAPSAEPELLSQLGSAFDAMLQDQAIQGDHLTEGIEGELFSAVDAGDDLEGLVSADLSGGETAAGMPEVPQLADRDKSAGADTPSPIVTEADLFSAVSPPSSESEQLNNPKASPPAEGKAPAEPAPEPVNQQPAPKRLLRQSIRVDSGKIDALMNQVGELVVNRAYFSQLCNEMRELQHYLKQSRRLDKREFKQVSGLTFRISEATVALGRVANELQEGVMRVRMLPIAQLFNRYPRLVHDLARSSGKKVTLEVRGEDTELDKMVIERIADPLVHIIRNAVDHGLETIEERRRKGKPERGTLALNAYHESNHVVIEIEDDGSGVDLERIRTKAIEKGLIGESAATQLSEREIINLILIPGFSTADTITHTSGRGVGMDVVKKNIEKLNGTLEVETTQGQSTRIRIKIPLTLAIIPALLVRVKEELFTIPLSVVDETLRVFKEEISVIEGVDVMYLRDETIPLIRLRDIFGMGPRSEMAEKFFVVIVNTGQKRVGLIVDNMLGQEEVVIKPLEDYLQENSGFSGATILGDGQISLILDVYELIKLSTHKQARRQVGPSPN
jgi:two-component system chemotaxis sensor kinase CheA